MPCWKMEERYERWWLNKLCRRAGYGEVYRRVVQVKLVGPYSFVYGCVYLKFEDGEEIPVQCGEAFKPRKSDIEVLDESEPAPKQKGYTAEEYTPAIKRRKAVAQLVELGRCENCGENGVISSGICVRCGHSPAIK